MYNELNIGQLSVFLLLLTGAIAFIYMTLAIGFRKLQEWITARRKLSLTNRIKETVAKIEANKKLSDQVSENLKRAGRNKIAC